MGLSDVSLLSYLSEKVFRSSSYSRGSEAEVSAAAKLLYHNAVACLKQGCLRKLISPSLNQFRSSYAPECSESEFIQIWTTKGSAEGLIECFRYLQACRVFFKDP